MRAPDEVDPAEPALDVAAAIDAGVDGSSPGHAPEGWQPLAPGARRMFLIGGALGYGVLGVVLLIPLGVLLRGTSFALPLGLLLVVALPAWGVWMALRRYASTRWRLDGDGYALRRGRLWQQETFVPRSRVQHLDLQRGPLERRFGLATLVIHTAGTRSNAVSTRGLASEQAEWLRDQLARWIETDDEA